MWSFLRRYLLFLLVMIFCISGTAYYFYWHWKPFTQNAFVFANTRPVSVMVDGFITEVHVKNNQFVKKGDPLFTTFIPPYALRVKALEHEIAAQRARLKGLHAQVLMAKAEVDKVTAEAENNRYLANRAGYMYEGQAVSQAYNEERFRAKQASESQLLAAKHKVDVLTFEAESTAATIDKLLADLELANVYLKMTVVRALDDGYVTNMSVSPGGVYRTGGEVLFGFVASDAWWVQANFKETELSEIKPGQKAKIWLWQYPGKVFDGVVDSIGWSAERRRTAADTGLPIVEKENEWFLLPQRFPVQIRILHPEPEYPLHPGASAFVEVDTPARPIRQFFWQLFLWDFPKNL